MMFTEDELKRIIKEGEDTELWKVIVQIVESERSGILEKIDDLDNYPDLNRDELIRHRNYLKWFIGLPERMKEKEEIVTKNEKHLMSE